MIGFSDRGGGSSIPSPWQVEELPGGEEAKYSAPDEHRKSFEVLTKIWNLGLYHRKRWVIFNESLKIWDSIEKSASVECTGRGDYSATGLHTYTWTLLLPRRKWKISPVGRLNWRGGHGNHAPPGSPMFFCTPSVPCLTKICCAKFAISVIDMHQSIHCVCMYVAFVCVRDTACFRDNLWREGLEILIFSTEGSPLLS